MNVDSFLDINVLVYAAAGRGTEESKRVRALELLEMENFGLSAQVLQEFYVTVARSEDLGDGRRHGRVVVRNPFGNALLQASPRRNKRRARRTIRAASAAVGARAVRWPILRPARALVLP